MYILIFSSFKTPLHDAAHRGYIECVRSLLDGGADVNAKDVSCEREMKSRQCE